MDGCIEGCCPLCVSLFSAFGVLARRRGLVCWDLRRGTYVSFRAVLMGILMWLYC
jgi:hypothetical protein